MKKKNDWLGIPRPLREHELIAGFVSMKNMKISWDNEKFRAASQSLLDAIKNEDRSVVSSAAKYMDDIESHPSEALRSCTISFAAYIYEFMKESGCHTPKKADVLAIIESKIPDGFKTIPTSKTALREWWKMVDSNIEQSRGYIKPEMKRLISELSKEPIRFVKDPSR